MADGNSDQCGISQDLTSRSNISPKEPCLANKGSSFHQIDDSTESQGSHNSRLGQELSLSSMIEKKDPEPGQTSEVVNEKSSTRTPVTDSSYENNGRNNVTVGSPKDSDACAGSDNDIKSKLSSDQEMKCNSSSEQYVKSPHLLQTSNVQPENVHANSESGTSAEVEDDVKVCDICGDAGVEEWLAICSRCSDGAEHIYCMRVRLDEVPQGDWLCEECQLKEDTQNHSVMKSEAESGTTEEPRKNGSSQNTETTINARSCPPVESELIVPAVTESNKEGTEISTKQKAVSQEVSSKSNNEAPETCDGLTSCVVPKKATLLSRESSFNKSDTGRVKSPKPLMPSGQPENIVLHVPRSHISSESDSLRFQSRTDTLKGSLSKSFSFNSSKVPKVKQFNGNIPQKQNVTREYNSIGTKKEGPVRTITKAASFRNASVGCSSNENRADALNLALSDALKSVKQLKDKSSVDKKISFLPERPSAKPSLVSGTNVTSLKPDVRVAQYEGNSKRMVELGDPGIRKGPNDANTLEVKRQSFSQSKCSGSASAGRLEDQKPFPLAPKVSESMQREDRSKEPTFFSGLKSSGPSGSRILRCQRCNETGHSTQSCGVDKLRVSALKPSSDRSTKDCGNKAKLKDNVEIPVMKPKDKKSIRSSEQSEEVSTSAADPCSEATSSDCVTSSFNHSKNFPPVEGTADTQKVPLSFFSNIKAPATVHVKHKVADQKNSVPAPRRDGIILARKITGVSSMKPVSNLVPDQAVLSIPFITTVIPELEYVWQGAFEVLKTGKDMATYDGFQAHLSNRVSPEALKVATKFPYRIQLEEVPRKNLWPSCFQTNGPKEDNIGLFFFAKDLESYEKYYEKQLDNMMRNDLALRACVCTVDLLIFPSNLLPEDYQRWNKLFFFWGVFRRRKDSDFKGLPTCGEKLLTSNFSSATLANLPNQIPSVLPTRTDGSTVEDLKHELSRPVISLEPKNTLNQTNADAGISLEKTSGSLSGSWSSKKDHESTCVANCPQPKIDIDIEKLPTEGERAESSLRNVENIAEDARILHDNPENAESEEVIKLAENCVKGEASIDNKLLENVVDVDEYKEEPKSTHKRLYSDSEQPFEQFSCHVQEVSNEKMLKNNSGTENKKIKLNNGGHSSNGSSDGISAWMHPRIHPLAVGVDNGIYDKKVSESSLSAGTILPVVNGPPRYLFAGDKSPAVSMKQKEPVYVLSSDDEEPSESSTPDLELALGGNKRQKMPEIFPLFSPKVEMASRDKQPASPVEVVDDELASLSLSLAVPVPKKTSHTPNEQHLPDKPCINKSLLLFRGFPES